MKKVKIGLPTHRHYNDGMDGQDDEDARIPDVEIKQLGGLGEIHITVIGSNLKLISVMEDLKDFIETNGIDALIEKLKP